MSFVHCKNQLFRFVCVSIGLIFLMTPAGCDDHSAPAANPSQTASEAPENSDGPQTTETPSETPVYTYRTIADYPHDPDAFTQGLIFQDGIFYEGTGLYGRSSLRKAELETGRVIQKVDLPENRFGEGVTVLDGHVYQLTWRSGIGYIYDAGSFQRTGQFRYSTQGWGLTHDGKSLIRSDGTPVLHFHEPETFKETGQVEVFDENGPVAELNELEYIDGEIYANVWRTDRIARIHPETGRVAAWIDLTGLLDTLGFIKKTDVLNGIAYDRSEKRLFVTGKLWPRIFEIELVTKND